MIVNDCIDGASSRPQVSLLPANGINRCQIGLKIGTVQL